MGELQDTLTLDEFNAWVEFDKVNPLSDRRRIYAPAALIASAFGGKFEALLNFLLPKPQASRRPLKPVEVIRVPKE